MPKCVHTKPHLWFTTKIVTQKNCVLTFNYTNTVRYCLFKMEIVLPYMACQVLNFHYYDLLSKRKLNKAWSCYVN